MKTKLILLTEALLLMTGCAKENAGLGEKPLGPEIVIGGEINQEQPTKADDGGFCSGDKIGIYVVEYEDETTPGTLQEEDNYADNVRHVLSDAGNNTWTPDQPIYYPENKIDIYGYYPYSDIVSTRSLPFDVAKDQSTSGTSSTLGGYESSDFLLGKASAISSSTNKVNITFKHILSSVNIVLSEGSGWESGEWEATSKEMLVINTKRSSTIDLATGSVSATGDAQSTGIIPADLTSSSFKAIVVPQTVSAGTAILNVTIGGKSILYTPSEATEYGAGRQLNINLSVTKPADGSGISLELLSQSITAWESDGKSHTATFGTEYLVVNCPTPGTLADCIRAKGKDITKVKNLKVTGTIDAYDFWIMRDSMTVLQAVNLKEVSIAAKNEWYDKNGNWYAGANAAEIPNYAFNGKTTMTSFVFPDSITKIGISALGSTNIKGSLLIPNGVTEVGLGAFEYCSSLSGILQLPDGLETIGSCAFYQCSGLNGTLDIPETVKSIGESAFSDCSGFTGSLILPKELKSLGSRAFFWCTGFTGDLTIPYNITSIESGAFQWCNGLNGQLYINDNCHTIANYAFDDCNFTGTLKLPKNLISIGEQAFQYNNFSGELLIPSTVQTIKAKSFNGCTKISGTLEIPEGIQMVPSSCFCNTGIESLVLPSTIESIQGGAFSYNYSLKEIVCRATSVPNVNSSAFDGIPSDVVVRVPYESLNDYKTATPWNQYAANMVAYYNLSLDRDLIQALNASQEVTISVTCEAQEGWQIQSKPDWVSVSATSGTGPAEITLAINALEAGSADRNGELIIELSDPNKDYSVSVAIDQYNYQCSSETVESDETSDVSENAPIGDGNYIRTNTHTKGSGVNLVFLGDGYNAYDIKSGKYLTNLRNAIGHFFAVEPYKSYKDYFDVYILLARSEDSGIYGEDDHRHKSRLGGKYYQGIGYKPVELSCFNLAKTIPGITDADLKNTLITVVMNTNEYPGVTYMWSDGRAIACVPVSTKAYPYDFRGYVQHECGGHGFGKLGDESHYKNTLLQFSPLYQAFKTEKSYGWYDNLSDNANRSEVPWAKILKDPTYNQYVDMFEGGYSFSRGVYRSEQNSCMNNFIPYFSVVSRMSIVERILSIAGEEFTYEGFKSKDVPGAVVSSSSATKSSMNSELESLDEASHNSPVLMGNN